MAKVVCELLSAQAEMEPDLPGADSCAGAILDFRGVVRGLENGRAIEGIDYEAHEAMAQSQLERLAHDVAKNFDLQSVLVRHRIGFVVAGDASLVVRLTSTHRGASLKAMAWLIDELKKKVPIWKHPKFVGADQLAPAAEVSR
jgi:molybdopterin synthase catalytic subunit